MDNLETSNEIDKLGSVEKKDIGFAIGKFVIGKVAVGNIPIIGSSLVEFMNIFLPDKDWERLKRINQTLHDRLKKLELEFEKLTNKEDILSFGRLITKDSMFVNNKKFEYLLNIFSNSIKQDFKFSDEIDNLYQIMNSLSVAKILVLMDLSSFTESYQIMPSKDGSLDFTIESFLTNSAEIIQLKYNSYKKGYMVGMEGKIPIYDDKRFYFEQIKDLVDLGLLNPIYSFHDIDLKERSTEILDRITIDIASLLIPDKFNISELGMNFIQFLINNPDNN